MSARAKSYSADERSREELKLRDRSACGGDLFACTTAELVRAHRNLHGQLAVAEHLDKHVLAHRSVGHQLVDTDVSALGEQPVDITDVDDGVLGAEPVAEAL